MVLAVVAVLASIGGGATGVEAGKRLRVERVVLLMRHGVRPPTKAPPMPAGIADRAWPDWPVPPGWLTPHGAAAVKLLAQDDRRRFVADALLSKSGCPAASGVRLIADSDQRTIATAQAYAEALAPGCAVPIEHRPQGEDDPLFTPPHRAALSPAAARDVVDAAAGPGGLDAAVRRAAPALATLDRILCARPTAECGVLRLPTTLGVNDEGRPKLAGALDRGSTAAQILLLEYTEGKPPGEVGWGRADAAAIARVSMLHALEFGLLARPVPFARRNLVNLAPLIRDALFAPGGAAVTMIAGHDTNVASLAGLLGVHWQVPGAAADDPVPGGALVMERVVDRRGRRSIRVFYRTQTPQQIRALDRSTARAPYRYLPLPIGRCGARRDAITCPSAAFASLLEVAPAP